MINCDIRKIIIDALTTEHTNYSINLEEISQMFGINGCEKIKNKAIDVLTTIYESRIAVLNDLLNKIDGK